MELKVESIKEIVVKKEGGAVERNFVAHCTTVEEGTVVSVKTSEAFLNVGDTIELKVLQSQKKLKP